MLRYVCGCGTITEAGGCTHRGGVFVTAVTDGRCLCYPWDQLSPKRHDVSLPSESSWESTLSPDMTFKAGICKSFLKRSWW